MVSPARRREAVAHVQEGFEVGERRACRVLGQPRSTQRYEGKRPKKDRALIAEIHRIAGSEPRAGYRTVTRLLRREGWEVNAKRVHRLWKQEGLKVDARSVQNRPRGRKRVEASTLAIGPVHVSVRRCSEEQSSRQLATTIFSLPALSYFGACGGGRLGASYLPAP